MNPTSEQAVVDLVADAVKAGRPLTIEGGGTRSAVTRPIQSDATLNLSGLTGITLYEPAEMVIGAWAGTPLSEIEAALAQKNQMLSFEPADYRAALGTSGEPTIGGVVAGNVSGPRRIMAGAARDNLIGVRFVNGRGEIIKNGGRVMKNVTGLDLVKLQAGAWGTLGVLTEVIFKVTPCPPEGRTLLVEGLSDRAGVDLLGRAMGTPFEVNGAAHLPADGSIPARTMMRLEGFPDQLDYRIPALMELLGVTGQTIAGDEHIALWKHIRDIGPLTRAGDPTSDQMSLWRISCPAMAGPDIVAAIAAHRPAKAFYDWSGGLVWLQTGLEGDAGADTIRTACEPHSGAHATLFRAPPAIKANVPVFNPLESAHMTLTRSIKASLDPQGLFNPGAMYAGV
ncbi:MAG: glycolate oxidase subunit GlcE [Hyphomicrobiales bacterium]